MHTVEIRRSYDGSYLDLSLQSSKLGFLNPNHPTFETVISYRRIRNLLKTCSDLHSCWNLRKPVRAGIPSQDPMRHCVNHILFPLRRNQAHSNTVLQSSDKLFRSHSERSASLA
ncbi:hypothetical protein AVEN_214763-1 [Araneus ventricosus]|uniref:Uncharacterized protein n=1 Tax=Araneus ventricosus TaxID=182803 RepID=A0A4Y2E304_ARAVE|nr:hypothetical protein AVEN_206914-1 [Araneus ventricosus]GBM22418.1 hypothetical protein AVEN_214763-1 [Araneus ventricosus]